MEAAWQANISNLDLFTEGTAANGDSLTEETAAEEDAEGDAPAAAQSTPQSPLKLTLEQKLVLVCA